MQGFEETQDTTFQLPDVITSSQLYTQQLILEDPQCSEKIHHTPPS